MSTTVRRFRRSLLLLIVVGLILVYSALNSESLAQSQATPQNKVAPYSSVAISAPLPPEGLATSQANLPPGPGITIIPTFDPSIDANTEAAIKSAIIYYEKTIVSPITVHIYYYEMDSGLGLNSSFIYDIPYSSYRSSLGTNKTSPDDATALAHTPSQTANPANPSSDNVVIKVPTGLALGLGTTEATFSGGPCSGFTGSGCLGINVTEANDLNVLRGTIMHEMDEVLGLGSKLSGDTTPTDPEAEDLFRWASAGTRSYSANPSGTNACGAGTPPAYFSINGGDTDLDDFNNCNNGGDYGDWVTHDPSQVQDAFTDGIGNPTLLVGNPEVRALDVLGFNIAFRNFADMSVWRPSSGQWFIIPVDNPGTQVVQSWGLNGDVPVRGDFDGDGITDITVWRPSSGQWYVIPSSNPGTPIVQSWGLDGDIPVPGDYDGDGITDFAIWRPSTGQWFIIPSSNPGTPIVQSWGLDGDIPVPGDYDGDRKTDFAVWRPSTGQWFIIPSSNPGSPIVQSWGLSGDIPVPGDYDGDGKTDVAVWRQSTGQWYIIPSSNPGTPIVQSWGLDGDIPVPGDYDGDGKTDFAVWRPSTGQWFVIPSSAPGSSTVTSWGLSGDIPVERPIGFVLLP